MHGRLHAPAVMPPGKSHDVTIEKQAWWAPKPVWTGFGKPAKPHDLTGTPTPDRPVRSRVTVPFLLLFYARIMYSLCM
jgi:hypothetical protein